HRCTANAAVFKTETVLRKAPEPCKTVECAHYQQTHLHFVVDRTPHACTGYCLVEDPPRLFYHALHSRTYFEYRISTGPYCRRYGDPDAGRNGYHEKHLGHSPVVYYRKLLYEEQDRQLVYRGAQPPGRTSYFSQYQPYTLHKYC